jgi:hypothetical protein
MDEHSWPDNDARLAEAAADRWRETVEALPAGSTVTGTVIGRQPFGVFVEIAGTPGAVGLAEITSMPREAALPSLNTIVQGTVIGFTQHNHVVKLRPDGEQHQEPAGVRSSRRLGDWLVGGPE